MTESKPTFAEPLRRLAAQLTELLHTRLRLFGVELSLQVRAVLGSMAWALVAAAFATFAMVMTVVTLLMAFWEQRVWIAGGLMLLFALIALLALWQVRRRLQRLDEFLGSSTRELDLDRDALIQQSEKFRSGLMTELNTLDEQAQKAVKGAVMARLGVFLLLLLRRLLRARR